MKKNLYFLRHQNESLLYRLHFESHVPLKDYEIQHHAQFEHHLETNCINYLFNRTY